MAQIYTYFIKQIFDKTNVFLFKKTIARIYYSSLKFYQVICNINITININFNLINNY